VTDYNDILGDASINVVVELMGGVTSAKDVVFGAINAGKHVVTANKALIAAFLPEIQVTIIIIVIIIVVIIIITIIIVINRLH